PPPHPRPPTLFPYTTLFRSLHRRFTTAEVPLPVWLFERMAIPADGRVLELGCGTGDYWQEVADRVPPDWRLTLTDFSEGMVRERSEEHTSELQSLRHLVCRL